VSTPLGRPPPRAREPSSYADLRGRQRRSFAESRVYSSGNFGSTYYLAAKVLLTIPTHSYELTCAPSQTLPPLPQGKVSGVLFGWCAACAREGRAARVQGKTGLTRGTRRFRLLGSYERRATSDECSTTIEQVNRRGVLFLRRDYACCTNVNKTSGGMG
jgi:hypothetical protein